MTQYENKPAAAEAAGSVYDDGTTYDAVPVEDDTLDLFSTKQLTGKKVWEGRGGKAGASGAADAGAADAGAGALKKLGRVKAFVFHPADKRCIGFLVKRPDAAWMFRRQDVFVGIGGFDIIDGRAVIGASALRGKAALKAAGASMDECVLWQGLPVVCEDGVVLGTVGDVLCELGSGAVYALEVSKGVATNAVLGTLTVEADEIVGFAMYTVAAMAATPGNATGGRGLGGTGTAAGCIPAIVVKDAVQGHAVEGGVAEKAGEATAVIAHNAKKAIETVKPKAKEVTAAAGDAVNQGAYLAGRQLERTKGMFSAFKEEFTNALHDDNE